MRKTIFLIVIISVLLASMNGCIFAAGNIAEEMYKEGVEFFEQADYDRAFARFQISGDVKGYAPAQNMLGICFRDGLGTEQSYEKAKYYFGLAAEQGDQDAAMNLALILAAVSTFDPIPIPDQESNVSEADVISIGSILMFGSYEQDNNYINGKEKIEWYVIAKDGSKVLLLSKYALDQHSYNDEWIDTTWESCTLRKWLNEVFFELAFLDYEKVKITGTMLTAGKNPDYKTNPGDETIDKVFILSVDEFESLPLEIKTCAGTPYCYAQGAHESQNGNCSWWLRTPGWYQKSAVDVNNMGIANYDELRYKGYNVNHRGHGIRPSIWVNIDA